MVISAGSLIYNCRTLVIGGRYGLVCDYTEPQNGFALAMTSQPSRSLAGCRGGLEGKAYGKRWQIDMQTDEDARDVHFFFRSAGDVDDNEVEEEARERHGLQGKTLKRESRTLKRRRRQDGIHRSARCDGVHEAGRFRKTLSKLHSQEPIQ